MWKLLGFRNEEGFDPNKTSAPGRARKMSQVSNMPFVFIEGDRDKDNAPHNKRFDFNELKDAFNGRVSRVRGVSNSGFETDEDPFRSAVVIAQNDVVDSSEPVMQRIVHCYFSIDDCNSQTQVAG